MWSSNAPCVWSTCEHSPKKWYYIIKYHTDNVGADVFIINYKNLLCIIDYHSKLPIVKKVNSLLADDLLQITKPISAKYGLLKKIVSDADTNFTSKTFKDICR